MILIEKLQKDIAKEKALLEFDRNHLAQERLNTNKDRDENENKTSTLPESGTSLVKSRPRFAFPFGPFSGFSLGPFQNRFQF